MSLGSGRLEREYRTMRCMVQIYCADHHATAGGALCEECGEFLDYAQRRLEKCPYGEDKPVCAKCPIHCYKRAQREQAQVDHALRGSAHGAAPSLAQPHPHVRQAAARRAPDGCAAPRATLILPPQAARMPRDATASGLSMT